MEIWRRFPVRIKAWLILPLVLVLLLFSYLFLSSRVAAFFAGRTVTMAELRKRLNVVQFSYDLQFADTPSYRADFAETNKEEVLRQMISEHFLLESGQGLLPQEDALNYGEELLAWMRLSLFADEPDRLAAALGSYNLTETDLVGYLADNFLLTNLYEEITAEVEASEDEVSTYFNQHPGEFVEPEMVKVSHILLDDEETAQALLAKLGDGADFSSLAAEYSLDTDSAPLGGSLPWFARGQMEAGFEGAAFQLDPGEISPIIVTGHGYHIIKVEERDAGRELTYEEAESYAMERVLQLKRDALWDTHVRELQAGKLILILLR